MRDMSQERKTRNEKPRIFDGLMTIVYCLLSIVYCLPAHAESADGLYNIATESYKAKNYQQAIAGYEKLISEGYRSAAVYYNLGNAYYKSDSISPAILNYERALRLSPSDEDIRFNLNMANLKTIDRISPVPQLFILAKWQALVSSRSSAGWSVFSIVCFWLAFVAFALYLFVPGIRRAGFYSGCGLTVVSLFFFWLSYQQWQTEYGGGQAILTASNTFIKSAPDAAGTDLFMIHEGVKLNILDKVGAWSKVRLDDGKVGWVAQGTFSVI